MSGEMLDTSPDARCVYFERLAEMTPSERLALMRSGNRMIRGIVEAAIRSEHPDISEEELRTRVAVRFYGRETVARVLGDLPADAR